MATRNQVIFNAHGIYVDVQFDDATLAVAQFNYRNLGDIDAEVTVHVAGRQDTVRTIPSGTPDSAFAPPRNWNVGMVVNSASAQGFSGNGWSVSVTTSG